MSRPPETPSQRTVVDNDRLVAVDLQARERREQLGQNLADDLRRGEGTREGGQGRTSSLNSARLEMTLTILRSCGWVGKGRDGREAGARIEGGGWEERRGFAAVSAFVRSCGVLAGFLRLADRPRTDRPAAAPESAG